MTKTVSFSEAEIAEPQDFDAISAYARAGDEAITSGAIDYPHHWADITIGQASAVELSINHGHLFAGGVIYANDAPITINLQAHLPLVTGDRRYVALLLRGVEETISERRMIEVDVDTGETVQMAVPKTGIRRIEVVVQQGLSSPTPIKPSVSSTECCLAFVELGTTGIAAIEMDHGSRVKSLYEVDGRLSLVEGDVANTTRRVSTIETDIANIAARLGDIPHPTIMRQIKRDLGAIRRQMALPDEARAYWFDPALLQDDWDKTHPNWLARIREGIRFPWAAERDARLELIDASASQIRLYDTLLMPAWTETLRLDVAGDGSSTNISQIPHSVVNVVRREVSRTVTEYGPTVTVCENNTYWADTHSRAVGELFTANGETFEVVAITGNKEWAGHVIRAVRQVIQRTVTDVYWDHVTEEMGVNGAVYGQTWLCSQPMILTSLDLPFTRVGTSGDVHLFVCECDEGGEPRFSQVIANATVAAEDLTTGHQKFAIRPSLLESGKRYAWFVVTTGNHALETVSGNKYAQGSRFYCTDGVWSQVSTEVDFAFRLYGAAFTASRTVIEFQPLTLENGMTEIRLLTAGWAPGGTALQWEISPSDSDMWQPLTLDATNSGALDGLPALVRLRAVFVGTTDLQPALVLDSKARGMTFRPRADMVAIAQPRDLGITSETIQVEAVLDVFYPALHTAAIKLIANNVTHDPDAVVVTPDISNPEKRRILATFEIAGGTSSAAPRLDMTSTSLTRQPFGENIALYAL